MKKAFVIAPSKSLSIVSKENIDIAIKKLNSMGVEVSFSKNVNKGDNIYHLGTIEERINDLNDAFKSDSDIVLTAMGGYNCNQLLPYIDYELIKNNPKIICGYSDITALLVAIYAKTGIKTYYGPHFSTFGMIHGIDYTADNFLKIINEKKNDIKNSDYYRDDPWYIDQNNINDIKNEGLIVINKGIASGNILGGNLCTLNLLQGTEYMPNMKDVILFIEDDDLSGDDFIYEFDRNLESLLQTDIGKNLKGIVVGKCQVKSEMNTEKWKLLFNKEKFKDIPIIVDANFGHTTPIFTFPIGGYAKIEATDNPKILIGVDENEI